MGEGVGGGEEEGEGEGVKDAECVAEEVREGQGVEEGVGTVARVSVGERVAFAPVGVVEMEVVEEALPTPPPPPPPPVLGEALGVVLGEREFDRESVALGV